MNALQMNLKTQVNHTQSTTSKPKDLMKRKESSTFNGILSENMKQQKEYDFKKKSDEKFIENTNSEEKLNAESQSIQKEKTEKNSITNNEAMEKIENAEKDNAKEELPQELMDFIASLNKLLEEMDKKMLVEGKDVAVTASFEELKSQINEFLSNMDQNNIVATQDTASLKETLMQLMNQFETAMDQTEVKVESEDFNELLSKIKAVLEDNQYDKTKDTPVTNDVIDKKDLTNVQSKEDAKKDTETVKNEVSVNTKNETKADSENERQMSQNENKEGKSGFFANKEQKIIISDKIIQELPTTYNVQSNVTSVENIKIENDMLQKPNFNNILEQMVEKAQVIVDEKGSEMSLQLKPDNLGNLSMKIAVERGIVIANIVAENQAVKEVIESNFNALRDALNEKGFGISELNVSVGQDSDFQKQQNFMNSKKKSSGKMAIDKLDYEDSILNEEANDISAINTSKINHLG
ncbi:flagellar hook-length control protein FliK [Marinisporobacter balticus]|uniref:Flagellar hook-length control protein FliK n=1 Tax=Marinisporobacter balticus TaxID=2018667 RepID=A0A4R2L7G7_9FIRM|nr:flagellar hook-length control protein FliK [Marinisporobacter balticus]TCO79946.1 flagellar hook-length control protein FliK [Marinisporobacter balticus]